MLESLAATLLNRLLGSYVENFDPAQLNVGIWSGDVRLKNLKLRKDCLDGLNLPIDVKFGILGELILNVPWSSLKNKPVKIHVEDCYILCSPRDAASFDIHEQIERELRMKLRRLAEWELTEQAKLSVQNSGSENDQNESFMQSLMTKVVDNLQVTIKHIHIRYEDMMTVFSKDPCSIGLTLNELSAVSTDSNWKPSFISITQSITHKLLTLNSLCFYYNTNSKTLDEDEDIIDNDILFAKLKNSVSAGASIPNFQYILRPVTGEGQLSVNKLGSTDERPHIELKMLYDEFGVELDDSEYADILHTLSKIHLSQKTQKFRKFRPDYPVEENPTGWLKYAVCCVVDEIKERNKMWVWENIKKRCNERREYIDLWIKKLQLKNPEEKLPDNIDEDQLQQLHSDLDYDSIILFRTIAKKRYSKMRLNSRDSKSPSQQSSQKGGWFSSWWGGEKQQNEDSNDLIMTKEQRQELYDAIDFTEGQDAFSNISVPKDRATMKISSLLKKGAFSIKRKAQNTKLTDIIFENCEVDFLQRPDSFLAAFKLHEFKVEDGSTNTIYKHIISVKKQNSKIPEDDPGISEPLFEAEFESNPLDESADSKIDVKLRGMTIFYHVHFINEIIRFFNPPKQHLDTIGAIINAAGATVEGWTTQTRMGIESLLEEHKTANVTLDLQAPLIIVPLDPHVWDTPCAVIDAGHIALASDLVPKEEMTRIKEMTPEEYSQIDEAQLNKLMFDRFQLYLQDTQILIGPDIRTTITSLDGTKESSIYSILSGLLLEVTLDVSILPRAYNLPKFRAFANLPKLNISLNDYQYKIVMQLLEKCTPSTIDIFPDDEFKDIIQPTDGTNRNDQLQLYKNMKLLSGMSSSELDQKLLDIQFHIELVQISMYKCIDDKSMRCKKLIDILGGQLKLNFIKKAKEMTLGLSMHSLEIEDFIENNTDDHLSHLVSSSILNSSETKDLFTVDYRREQRIVNHKNLLIEVFDQNIEINMAQLQFVLTPTSILTLMNFALTTFTDPDAAEMPADVLRHNKENREDAPQKLTMNVRMEGMVILLNDDSIKLATLVLSAANFSMVLLPEKMKVNMKLGDLQLTDETSQTLPADSIFWKVISMSSKDLAELTYETFDSSNNPHNYDSILKYTTGSMNINFVEHSINKLVNFFYKFQRMKTLFDTAREVAYNQAPSIDSVNNMKMDITIKAPVIQFPKLIDPRIGLYDSVKFYLGEVFIQNTFSGEQLENKINHIKMGLRDGEISSIFNFNDNIKQELYIVEKMALTFDIDHDPLAGNGEPELKIRSYFDPLLVSITELQLHYLINLSESAAAAFTISESNDLELNEDVLNANAFFGSSESSRSNSAVDVKKDETTKNSEGAKLDFLFEAPEIAVTLYANTAGVTTLNKHGLTKLTFQDIAVLASYNNDGTADGESHVASFTVEDIRDSKVNKHTKLIPKVLNDNYQFMAALSSKKLEEQMLVNLSITVDSPRVLLAMDYLFALKDYFEFVFGSKAANIVTHVDETENKEFSNAAKKQAAGKSNLRFQYSLNVVGAAIILLADPSDINSEAVVFNVGQFLFSEQNITSVSANNVGMSLSRINSTDDSEVGLLNEFSSSIVIDKRDSTPERLLTNIQVSVEPLVLGISLRDIRLAMLVFNRVMSQMNGPQEQQTTDDSKSTYGMFSKEFEKKLSKYAPSFVSSLNAATSRDVGSNTDSDVTLRGERLNADFGGLRLFLIGDVHEMPILDMNVAAFQASVKDWSTDIDALASLEAYVNVFNYSRSSWEPLVESFPISFHLSKGSGREEPKMAFDVVSRKTAEVTFSSRSIAMLSQIPSTLTGDIPLKPRGALKPYRIVNDTGLDLDVWIVTRQAEEKKGLMHLKAGTTIPWEFEDWRRVRESLDRGSNDTILAAAIPHMKYKSIMQVDATHEGELMFTLEPSIKDVHNRIVCVLELGEDNVKTITFRSSLLLENTTSTAIQFMIASDKDEAPLIYEIQPKEKRSVPVEYAYNSRLKIRPVLDDYVWSKKTIDWRDLLAASLSLECNSDRENSGIFYLEVNGKFDKKEPLAKIYPHMTLVISSPLIIQNFLPCNLKFCLFDKREENRKARTLGKGCNVEIHDVSLDNFLLLSIQPLVDDASLSKPAIVNTARSSVLKPEMKISCQLAGGQIFKASLHYEGIEGTRAKIIKISAPYIVLNSTDRDLYIQGDYNNVAQVKVQMTDDNRYTIPRMFSFEDNGGNKNRARIRFKESEWSSPLSFDAIGQALDTIVNIPNKEQESNMGITIKEGEGIYAFSKIVEIAPRYIIQNCLADPVEICEHGSTNVLNLEPNASVPLYKMRNIVNKQLMIKFLGSGSEWSAPFFIKDIGLNFVKVLKQSSGHVLLKVEIILENATVFVRLKDAQNRWPYSIRNFSDEEFVFYQRDPRVVDDYYDYEPEDDLSEVEYKPLYYRVPPKSVMPYAWDYPAAIQKKLILTARGRRREIQLAQIGNLKPMRLPARLSNETPRTVDLNVIADGVTQAMVITNYNPDVSLYKLRTRNNSSSLSVDSSSADGFEVNEEDKNIHNRVVISFKGVGISLVNTSLEEIMYVHATGLEFRYNESDLYQTVSWKLRWLQVDNQLFGSPFQNILYPVAVPHTPQEIENHPVVSGSLSKLRDDSHGLIYFKHATLLLQELSIQLDDDLILAVLDFVKFPGSSWTDSSTEFDNIDEVTLPECQDVKLADDMYFEVFHVQPMMLHLSFVRSDQHQLLSKEKNGSPVARRGAVLFLVDIITMTLANVNDAPIKLNSLYMANVRVPLSSLLQAVQTHYGQQFFYQVHKIIGSADFLGNPVGLFNTISSGVWDIFYEPYQGYMMNDRPQELGINLARGGLSFAKKTVFGISDSMAKFTGSMAKGLSVTQGSQFQEQRRLQRRLNTNSRNILSSSAQTFANTIGSGLSGVALDPVAGAQREGTAGFLKGLGRGLIGLPAKTAIGVLDLTSSLSQGVRSTTTALDGPSASRFRLPRYVGYEDKILKPFDLRESQGQYWLKVVSGGLYMHDSYLTHVVLPGKELVVIVSMERIIELNLSSMETMWETTYREIQGIVLQKGGIHIKLKTQSEFFIPISDPQERRKMYKHIAFAVTEYNKYCEATL